MLYKITVSSKKDDEGQGKTYTFPPQKVKIGRLKDNDIPLDFPAVSGYHGKLRLDGESKEPKAYITDFGSLNGILVDGERIEANKEVPIEMDKPFQICIFNLTVSHVSTEEEAEDADNDDEDKDHSTATMPLAGFANKIRARGKPDTEESEKEASGKAAPEAASDKTDASSAKSAQDDKAKESDESPAPSSKKDEDTASKDDTKEKEIKTATPVAEKQKDEEKDSAVGQTASSSKGAEIKIKASEAAESELELEAEQLLTIWGMIKDQEENPVPEAKVDGAGLGKVSTDKDGSFIFKDIPEGSDYKITLSKPGYRFDPPVTQGSLEDDLSLEINAIELTAVGGKIIHNDNPLEGVQVDGGKLGKTESGKDGTFRFREVDCGVKYSLSFSKPQFEFEPSSIEGVAGEEDQDIEVKAIKLVEVKGRVVHKGTPLEGVEIDAGPLGKTKTDKDGRYKFENVREDIEFSITARKAKYNFKAPPKS